MNNNEKRGKKFGCAAVVLLAFPLLLPAQSRPDPLSSEVVKQGEQVYAKTCTFCHGEAGAGGSAPRLTGRGLDAPYIDRVVKYGIPETAMPAFGQRLIASDLVSVSSYIKSLNGIALPPSANFLRAMTGDAARGRDAFFDPTKELGGCSNCHNIAGKGVSVAQEIKNIPGDAAALRNLATRISTASAGGETFPALVVTQLKDETRLYDLTTVPPVQRMFSPSAVKLSDGSGWQHSSVVNAYSDKELEEIVAFLRAAVRP